MSNNIHFLDDNAISNPEQDLFNFKFYAEKVQKLIQLNSSNNNPITIGIYGKWGEGKTSFLNLIENKIDHYEKKDGDKEYLIFHFNPWRYSNEDEMIFDFFDGLAKRFYVKKETNSQKIGKQLIKYSRYLKSIKISSSFGIPTKLGTKITFDPSVILETLGEDLKGEEITLEILKDKVNEDLEKVNFKVVVFIDDLDRLDKEEIYTLLKLIKLNANFKNFIFIVSLDSDQVAKAIKDRYGNNIEDGHLFLDKIINIPIYLPRIEKEDLQYFFEINLKKILNNLVFLDEDKKGELLRNFSSELSFYNFKSPREVIKIINSFFTAAFAIGHEVNLKDLFWLQFIKIRNDECYNYLKNYSEDNQYRNYISVIDFQQNQKENPYEEREALLNKFENVNYILVKLFPKSNSNLMSNNKDSIFYNKNLNINSVEHFDKYFSFHMERKISNDKFNHIEKLIIDKSSVEISNTLQELFNDSKNLNEYKTVYKIEAIIQGQQDRINRNFFFKCIFENLDLIPETDDSKNKIRIIELIGRLLNDDINVEENLTTINPVLNPNEIISTELANILDLENLRYFLKQFYEGTKIEFNLVDIFNRKAKEYISEIPQFYLDHNNLYLNKSILYYLGNYENEFLTNLLETQIKDFSSLKSLIRNFAPHIESSNVGLFYGSIDREIYNNLKEQISVDFIYNKTKEFDSNFINLPTSKIQINQFDKATENENLMQFFHWYLQDENLKIKAINDEVFGSN